MDDHIYWNTVEHIITTHKWNSPTQSCDTKEHVQRFYLHSKIKSSFLGMHTFIECKNITKNKVSSRVAIAPSRKRGLALSEEGNTCGGINHVSDLHPRAGNRGVLCTFLHVCQSSQCKIFCYFNSNIDDFTAYRNLQAYFHENCFFVMCLCQAFSPLPWNDTKRVLLQREVLLRASVTSEVAAAHTQEV